MADDAPAAKMIERAARALCVYAGHDADQLEPGNVILHPLDNLARWEDDDGVNLDKLADTGQRKPDGHVNGEPCHFIWRQYIAHAQVALWAAFLP